MQQQQQQMFAASGAGSSSSLQLLGAVVTVRLTTGEAFTGEVFCYDMNGSNTIILKEATDHNHATFHLIKAQNVREVSAKGIPPPVTDTALPSCSHELLEYRERIALAEFQRTKHTIGIRVTQEAQEIFDFIHKTHPDCCWEDGSRIRVMGVTVSPPYRPEDCEGVGRPLERIKQVLERFIMRRRQKRIPASPRMQQQQQQQNQNRQYVQQQQLQPIPTPVMMQTPSLTTTTTSSTEGTMMPDNLAPGSTTMACAPPPTQPVMLVDPHGVALPGTTSATDAQGRPLYHHPGPGLMMMVLPGGPETTDENAARLAHLQGNLAPAGPFFGATAAGGAPQYRTPLVFATSGGGQVVTMPGGIPGQPIAAGTAAELNGVATMMQSLGTPVSEMPSRPCAYGDQMYSVVPEGSNQGTPGGGSAPVPGGADVYRMTQGMPPTGRNPNTSMRYSAGTSSVAMSPQLIQGSPQQAQVVPTNTGGGFNTQYKHQPRWNQGHGIAGVGAMGSVSGDAEGPTPSSTPTNTNAPPHGSMDGNIGTGGPHSGNNNGSQRGGKGGRAQRNRGNRRRE